MSFKCFVLDHYLNLVDPGNTNKVAKLDSKFYPGGDYCIEFKYRYLARTLVSLS